MDNFYSDFWLQQGQSRFFLIDVIRATKSKFNKKQCILNFNYIVIVLFIIILMCGDVELNPRFTIDSDKIGLVLNERNMEIPSTSTGILKQSIGTRDKSTYMRSFFQWQGDGDCFLDGTQNNGNNCFENLNSSHEKSTLQHSTGTCISQFFYNYKYNICKSFGKRSTIRPIKININNCSSN